MPDYIVIDIETAPAPDLPDDLAEAIIVKACPKRNADEVAKWCADPANREAALESTALQRGVGVIACVGLSVNGRAAECIDNRSLSRDGERAMLELVYDAVHADTRQPLWVAHNAGFDLDWLKLCAVKYGIDGLARLLPDRRFYGYHCTMAAASPVSGDRISLDTLAWILLGRRKSGDGRGVADLLKAGDWASLREYCINDVELTRDIYRKQVGG